MTSECPSLDGIICNRLQPMQRDAQLHSTVVPQTFVPDEPRLGESWTGAS